MTETSPVGHIAFSRAVVGDSVSDWFVLGPVAVLPVVQSLVFLFRSGGVAFWAHVGGFTAGMILVKAFGEPDRIAARLDAERWRPSRVLWQ